MKDARGETLTLDLSAGEGRETAIAPGAVLLPGFALAAETPLLAAVGEVTEAAPFRHMLTPGGHRMSAAMTSCGSVGWVTDRSGYRYTDRDPENGCLWPPMPAVLADLAARAAAEAGYPGFEPDACLLNRYEPGARMSLHQDRDEQDFSAPIVSVSLGLPVVFLFGGASRSDTARRIPLVHGDVVVWGGPSRLHFHGVLPLKEGQHPLLGRMRVNLTFRKAL